MASCFNQLNEFRKSGKHCDVTITIDGRIFPCHRLVLSSSSTYFSAMFNGSFDESKSNHITIKEVDPTAFAEVLDAMYTCSITLNKGNACRLLKACSFLGMPIFERACFTFINDYFPPDNLLEIGIFCEFVGQKELVGRIVSYVAEQFVQFSSTKEFELLPLQLLVTILSQSNLQKDEDAVLKCIVSWAHKNKRDVATIQKLLEVANLSKISSSFVAKLIASAEKVVFEEESTEVEQPTQKRIRLEITGSSPRSLMVYVKSMKIDNGLRGTCTLTLNEKGDWKPVSNLASSLATLKTVVIGRRQYFLGCDKNSTTGITITFWCIEDNKTTRLREPPVTVCRYKITAIDNTIFLYTSERGCIRNCDVISSLTMDKDKTDNAVYSYNCDLDTWYSIPLMYAVTYGSAAVTLDRHLYILGGYVGEGGTSQTKSGTLMAQRYDHRCPNWLKLPSPLFTQINSDACVFGKSVYLSGSYHENMFYPTCTSYNTVATKWESLKNMSCARANHVMVRYEDMLYVIDNRPFSINEKYHTKSNSWVDVPPLPKKLTIDDEIVVTYEVNDAATF